MVLGYQVLVDTVLNIDGVPIKILIENNIGDEPPIHIHIGHDKLWFFRWEGTKEEFEKMADMLIGAFEKWDM